MKNIKLLEVKGYYLEGDDNNFVEEKSWEGQVVLREDLTFEGIVVEQHLDETYLQLIYGTLVEYNGSSFMKFTNNGNFPVSYFSFSTGKETLGMWSLHLHYTKVQDIGNCKVIFREVPMDESVVTDILKQIEDFKVEMDLYSRSLYNAFLEKIEETATEFVKNMEEAKEDIEEIFGCSLKKLEF